MTTYTIDTGDIGQVISGPGVLTRIEILTWPAPGAAQTLGHFTLSDASGPNPRQLYNLSADNVGIIAGRSLGKAKGAIGGGGWAEIMSRYPMGFGALLVGSVPKGASFELEVQ
jgi:hypothetical protein